MHGEFLTSIEIWLRNHGFEAKDEGRFILDRILNPGSMNINGSAVQMDPVMVRVEINYLGNGYIEDDHSKSNMEYFQFIWGKLNNAGGMDDPYGWSIGIPEDGNYFLEELNYFLNTIRL